MIVPECYNITEARLNWNFIDIGKHVIKTFCGVFKAFVIIEKKEVTDTTTTPTVGEKKNVYQYNIKLLWQFQSINLKARFIFNNPLHFGGQFIYGARDVIYTLTEYRKSGYKSNGQTFFSECT